jgi:hypothetical protein
MHYGSGKEQWASIYLIKDESGSAHVKEPYRDSAYLTQDGPYTWASAPSPIAQLRVLSSHCLKDLDRRLYRATLPV